MDFSIHSNGLREVDEVRTVMLVFNWDVDSPGALRRRPSSPKPQTTTEIPPYINLLELGKESSAFQAAWRQRRQSVKAATFAVRGIRQVGMACLQQVPFTSMGQEGGSGVGGGRGRGRIRSASYRYFSELSSS